MTIHGRFVAGDQVGYLATSSIVAKVHGTIDDGDLISADSI